MYTPFLTLRLKENGILDSKCIFTSLILFLYTIYFLILRSFGYTLSLSFAFEVHGVRLDKAFAMSQPDSSRTRAKSIGHYILGTCWAKKVKTRKDEKSSSHNLWPLCYLYLLVYVYALNRYRLTRFNPGQSVLQKEILVEQTRLKSWNCRFLQLRIWLSRLHPNPEGVCLQDNLT